MVLSINLLIYKKKCDFSKNYSGNWTSWFYDSHFFWYIIQPHNMQSLLKKTLFLVYIFDTIFVLPY